MSLKWNAKVAAAAVKRNKCFVGAIGPSSGT